MHISKDKTIQVARLTNTYYFICTTNSTISRAVQRKLSQSLHQTGLDMSLEGWCLHATVICLEIKV